LSAAAWPKEYRLARHEVLDSTNDEARRLAASGDGGPVWIAARTQRAGRGRRGRAWEARDGDLAATLLLRPLRPREEWPQLSFVAAIAAADMVADSAPNSQIAVKWPNDVLADGRKLAGILLESVDGPALAIGIGVNLVHFPYDTEFPATSLAALGARPASPDDALTALAAGFAKWYNHWRDGGFAPIRDAWLARAAGLGARIRARLATMERSGVFQGIDSSGALLLDEGGGKLAAIPAAEIFFD
jgi:BirA family biotin operon repressor/biotin-[acetyl-CoA-carboxylase] ligase